MVRAAVRDRPGERRARFGKAPHPNAALLWYEFSLGSEAQKLPLLRLRASKPQSRNVTQSIPAWFIDSAAVLDDAAK